MQRPLGVVGIGLLSSVIAATACGGGGGDGPTFADDHPRIYLERNRARLAAALEEQRPAAERFRRIVDLQLDGADLYDFQAWYAALIGQLTGDPRYCEYAVAHADARVAGEEEAIAAGEAPYVAHDSYLEVGAWVGDVMLTYDWCFDHATEAQKTRWLSWAAQAVWNVWHPEEATWGGVSRPWSGWSIDNPSNNYYYSFLRATMLLGLAAHGEHADAAGWLTFVREDKIGDQLVPTFEADLTGGGSREGTGYGVSMHRLWELYDLWQGSTGEDLARLTGHTRASLLHMMHTVVPTRDRIAPVGDHARDVTAALFDYHRNYLQELAYLFRDDAVVPEAKWLLANSTVPEMDEPFMYVYDFLYEVPEIAEEPPDGLGRVYHAPGTGHVVARSSWETDATWVHLMAGPYTESHAHRDQGSILLYKGGWLAYDPIVDSRSGIRQEEELHNLVRISDGEGTVRQREGTTSELVALARGDRWVHAAADLTPAYDGHAAVGRVERELVFVEPDCVVVFDRVTSTAGTTQTWQLSAPSRPAIDGARATIDGAFFDLQVDRVVPAGAATAVHDWSTDGDFVGGYRFDATLDGGANQLLHVLSIAGTVTAVTRSDADGRTGVAITFADGRTATVRFSPDGVDGTLELRGAGGEVEETATLDEGVESMPE